MAQPARVVAPLPGQIVTAVEACASCHLEPAPYRVVWRFMPGQAIGAVGGGKGTLVVARLEGHLETPLRVGVIRFIEDHTGLDMVGTLVEIDQVIVAVAAIRNQPQVWPLPVIAIFAFGKTDPLKPACLLAVLPQIPHVQIITDLMHCPVVDDMAVIGCTRFAQAEDKLRAATRGVVTH